MRRLLLAALWLGWAAAASAQTVTISDQVSETADTSIDSEQRTTMTINLGYLYNGSIFTPLIGDATNGLKVQCTSGCSLSGLTTDTDDAAIASGQIGTVNLSLTQVYDGSVYRRFTIGSAGMASTQVVTVQGIASMTPLLATVTGTITCGNCSGSGVSVNEDVASANADPGTPAYAVRKATPANTSGTDGDYEALQMSAGRLWVDPSGVTLTVGSHAVTNAGTFAVQPTTSVSTPVTNVGTFAVQAAPNGGTSKRYISAGTTEDESQVKATPGTLRGMSAWNAHATTDAFLKCTNATAASTTPGSTAVIYSMVIPHLSGFVDRDINIAFGTALTCYIVTGKADSDTTEVGANDVSYNLTYD